MKFVLKFLCFLSLNLVFTQVEAQTKHGLIFAIGNYPDSGGWRFINSNRDVTFIERSLKNQGFLAENIKVVLDSAATKEGIIQAMEGLIEEVYAGDIVTIHFSSHGVQMQDDNGDELDNLDESIVPFEALSPMRSTNFQKDQSAYFRDDEFGALIDQIRLKLGKNGDVLVFMDSCHSGSGTRGLAIVRGGQAPFVSKDFVQAATKDKEKFTSFSEKPNAHEELMASYVVVSAARANELNYETLDENEESMGTLTYAISKAMENLEQGTTYRSLFAKIQVIVNQKTPGQNPVLEGTGLDRALFGGKYVEQKPYVEVESWKGNRMFVKGGLLAGLDEGAKIEVHPAGTNDPSAVAPFARGVVVKAESFSATVKLDQELGEDLVSNYWVFVTDPVYKIKPVVVKMASPTASNSGEFSQAEIDSLKVIMKELPLLRLEGTPDLLITQGIVADTLRLAASGHVFTTIRRDDFFWTNLKTELQRYTQYKLLQNIEIKDKNFEVEVAFVPVIDGRPDTTRINEKMVGGTYEFTEGDKLVIWVKNTGDQDVYVNILDMQPDGIINPVLPNYKQKIYASDLRIRANSSRLFTENLMEVEKPYGTEIYKIFVTKKEIDMEFIAAKKGQVQSRSADGFGVLEQLLKDSYSVASRGLFSASLGKSSGSTFNILCRIKPKKKD